MEQRSARLPVTEKVAGSNPVRPAIRRNATFVVFFRFMTPERPLFESIYTVPDENAQLAEAFDVVRHAIRKRRRGGRQGGRGRNPSMSYSGSRSRNPRECLRRAHQDLGFSSLQDAKIWLQDQPTDWSNKLNLKIKPKPENIQDLELIMAHPSVRLDYPTRVQKFLTYLNENDLADVRPIVLGINDALGTRSRLIMRIMSDPRPNERKSIVFDGRLIMRKARAVHCLDGQLHAIFPGHMARLHLDPAQGLQHIEFLDVLPDEEN